MSEKAGKESGTPLSFGKKLRRLRKERKLTQGELAAMLGLTGRTLINYEMDKCLPKQMEVVARIATLFDVTTDYLMSEEPEPVPAEEPKRLDPGVKLLLEQATELFVGGKLSEEERDCIVRTVNELYWEAKERDLQEKHPETGEKTAPSTNRSGD